ncbi:DUF6245 family protein [Spirillospora sp. NPDC049652]
MFGGRARGGSPTVIGCERRHRPAGQRRRRPRCSRRRNAVGGGAGRARFLQRRAGTPAEHTAETERLAKAFGHADAYRVLLANALLGAAQMNARAAEQLAGANGRLSIAARREQERTRGVLAPATGESDSGKVMEFARWQVLRAALPVREVASHRENGPVSVAAAHAADALQGMLGAFSVGRRVTGHLAGGDAAACTQELLAEVYDQRDRLRLARARLDDAAANLDILLDMLDNVTGAFGQS